VGGWVSMRAGALKGCKWVWSICWCRLICFVLQVLQQHVTRSTCQCCLITARRTACNQEVCVMCAPAQAQVSFNMGASNS
jgi:hypothetical protein